MSILKNKTNRTSNRKVGKQMENLIQKIEMLSQSFIKKPYQNAENDQKCTIRY